jgi:putative serine protease PepD
MRSQVVVPVVWAVLGGGVTAVTLLATGVVGSAPRSMFVPQAAPLLSSGPVGGTPAGAVYRNASGGVVGVTARAVPVPPSAFDVSSRRSDGMLAGSGFVVDTEGHVVTAAHLVRAAGDVRVDLGGRSVAAQVVGLDEANDLAVLRVDPRAVRLHPLPLGDSDAVRVGDLAIAMGRAAGLEPTLTSGTVAARQPRLVAPGGATVADALQVDAPLHVGDCGGPLLDAAGLVTGVNTRMVTASGETVEIAVPVNTVRRILPHMTGEAMKVVSG